MASTKEYRDYVLEQLKLLDNISCRPMMREYLFYYEGVYFGGVYDNRFLVKKTKTNEKFSLSEELPYDGAKPMYSVENLEDAEYLRDLVTETVKGLKTK